MSQEDDYLGSSSDGENSIHDDDEDFIPDEDEDFTFDENEGGSAHLRKNRRS